ncbi:MAG: ribonuclease Z [Bacteroidota bacterium]
MEKEIKENYILFSEKKSFENIVNFLESDLSEYSSDSLVVEVSELAISESQLEKIHQLSNIHKQNGMSFVVVMSNVSADDVEDSLSVAPSMQEAIDIVTMEDLERELGF